MRADDCLGVPNWNTSSRECKPNPQFTNEAFSIADVRFGLISNDGGWRLELFVNNVTDERAHINPWNSTGEYAWGRTGEYQNSHNYVTVRPREYGFRFTARWRD